MKFCLAVHQDDLFLFALPLFLTSVTKTYIYHLPDCSWPLLGKSVSTESLKQLPLPTMTGVFHASFVSLFINVQFGVVYLISPFSLGTAC